MLSTYQFFAGYKILPELELLIDVRVGEVCVEGLIEYKKMMELDKDFDKDYYSIVDTREMNWDILISDVERYVHELSKLKGGISSKKMAAGIYSSVHQLAYTQLIHKEFTKANQPQKFFTEIAPAIQWLGKNITPQEVEDIILSLKKQPQFLWK